MKQKYQISSSHHLNNAPYILRKCSSHHLNDIIMLFSVIFNLFYLIEIIWRATYPYKYWFDTPSFTYSFPICCFRHKDFNLKNIQCQILHIFRKNLMNHDDVSSSVLMT